MNTTYSHENNCIDVYYNVKFIDADVFNPSLYVIKVRCPVPGSLTEAERNEFVHSIGSVNNVPEEFSEMHSIIAKLYSNSTYYNRKELVFVYKSTGACFVDVILNFRSLSQMEDFIKENGLTAEKF